MKGVNATWIMPTVGLTQRILNRCAAMLRIYSKI